MIRDQASRLFADYDLWVFKAECFVATSGVHQGDPLKATKDICLGDGYTLRDSAELTQLPMEGAGEISYPGPASTTDPVANSCAGTAISATAKLTFMTHTGQLAEALVLGNGAHDDDVCIYPLTDIETGVEYILITIDTEPDTSTLPDTVVAPASRAVAL